MLGKRVSDTKAQEYEQVLSGSVRAVYALEGQTATDKQILSRQTAELTVEESLRVEQDVFARRLAQERKRLTRRSITISETQQQGSPLRDDDHHMTITFLCSRYH